MTNKSIADIFLKIADMLELQGANIFRVRAYRNAAHNITDLSRQLEDIYAESPSMIDNIPGIGKDLKGKIEEIVTTGKLLYFEELAKEFPEGFLELLNLEGLGPKKLKKLKDTLGIENIAGLEKVCREGRVAMIDGMGDKTQEKLLKSIKHFNKRKGRMLLPEADSYAENIIKYLYDSGIFKKLDKAGSLRRGKETVGDLDILATADDAGKAMDCFAAYPEVSDIIAKGSTKTSVNLKNGPQVDLRIVDDECFGAALVYFTGSKEHNVHIRKIAKTMGLKVSEYGVFDEKGNMVAGRNEKEVYNKLGMKWIPPELRENRGEIESAEENTLPKDLITIKDMRGDLHIHTSETDGKDPAKDMITAARDRGYEYIAITDHSKNVRVANGMDEKRLLNHCENIRRCASKIKGIKVLVGVEVDILRGGKLDIDDSVLKELDIVIAAVHSHFAIDKDLQTERILKAMDNKYVNVLAHPSGRLITTRSPLRLDFDRVFKKAVENNVILEINTHGERIDLNDINCRRAREFGAKFVINTDAHEIGHMEQIKYGVITARRGALRKKDVINTFSYNNLMKVLGIKA